MGTNWVYVFMYLVAIVLANLSVAQFGVASVIVNAFLFIGLDLTARDKLHDTWHGKNLWLKMFILIGAGSLLSWLLNKNAGQIALASMVAFGCAGLVDALVYQKLIRKTWMIRVNGSNLFSAMVDSIVFPTIAFGALMPLIILGQFAAKVVGGYVWSLILRKRVGTWQAQRA